MNYAALLGVIAAATFSLPLLARLAESLGLPRSMGVGVSLLIAALAAGAWYVRAKHARGRTTRQDAASGGKLTEGPQEGPSEEDDAGLQGHR